MALMRYEHRENYLAHYGVKGQQKGKRRYQNEDGTLTPEGREHYGIGKMTDQKRYLGGGNLRRAFADWRVERHDKNLQKAIEKGNDKKAKKYRSKLDAQQKANEDMEDYMKSRSNAKIIGQNAVSIALQGPFAKRGLHRYRKARARGQSGISAFVSTALPITGTVMSAHYNKKKYGKYLVWSGLDEEAEDTYVGDDLKKKKMNSSIGA